MAYSIVLVTLESESDADALMSILLKKRFAAGANLITGVRTRYWWKGQVQSGEETLLLIRTKKSMVPRLKREIKEFDPELETAPISITQGNANYEKWIAESVKDEKHT